MKTAIKTTKIITIGLFTFCVLVLTNATFAGTKSGGTPAELKFIGKVQNRPVFQLSLNNDESDEYFINIKDADYNTLYSEKVKGANLSRRYQLDIDEADLSSYGFGVRVEVTSAKTHKTEVYKISSQTKTTSNIIVAQL
jgi:hypothetical protein